MIYKNRTINLNKKSVYIYANFIYYMFMLINLIPIISIILLGYVLTKFNFLNDSMAENLKKIVVNVTLPVGLFSSFIKIRFELKYLLVFISVYVTCLILLNLGKLIAKIFKIKNKYFPFMLTGFEAGMIGYTLFAVAYGNDMYSTFGIVDIGQVSFVFTILVPMILAMNTVVIFKFGGCAFV